MINFFRKNINSLETEITLNPSILYDNSITSDRLSFYQAYLGDSSNKIELDNIVDTTLEKFPDNATSRSWHDGKTFYFVNNKEIEYKLSDRISSVLNDSGWIHLKNGIKYRIENKTIVEFAIHGEFLNFYKNIQKKDIEKKIWKSR